MKAAYADPPYIGMAGKHYSHDPLCAEVDHDDLIGMLCRDYDSWALSCSAPSLQFILSICPNDVRIGSWVKPFASFKPNVNPAYTWEPVIFSGCRKGRDRKETTIKDHVIHSITMRKGLVGAKPPEFCLWIIEMLGLQIGDELTDLFPGTGIMGETWEKYKNPIFSETLSLWQQ